MRGLVERRAPDSPGASIFAGTHKAAITAICNLFKAALFPVGEQVGKVKHDLPLCSATPTRTTTPEAPADLL